MKQLGMKVHILGSSKARSASADVVGNAVLFTMRGKTWARHTHSGREQIAGMTTSPGHKKSQQLIEAEAYRRIMSGEVPATLAEFGQQLSDWFREAYPNASPIMLAIIENQIRETWHRRHDMIRGGGS